MKKFLLGALLCASLTSAAFAAGPPWDGNWKLDPSKSKFAGTTFTYSKTAKGGWHYNDGAVSYDFTTDGKAYAPVSPDATTAITANSDHVWTLVFTIKGKQISSMREELSADGKTLTDHTTGTRPDGSKIDTTVVQERVGTGTGFAGTWKSKKVEGSAGSYSISTSADGTIKWDVPDYKETFEGKPDGSEHAITGEAAASGFTLSLKKTTPRAFEYAMKAKGKVMSQGVVTVSADGKTMTDVNWTPGKETEKTTSVYVKQ